jgi:O-antigen/teichoic acid export membrane protein
MAKVARNLVANMAGTFWGTLIGLLVVPLYLKFIGVEGYGLIGFYAVLSSLLSIVDAGFSATAGRELARSEEGDHRGAMREMVFVLERAFALAALAMGAAVILLAPLIATHWLNPRALSDASAVSAVRLMGGVMILQFPLALYHGCLMGLQRHVLLNGVSSAVATLRAVGGVLILWLVSATVEAFFAWQMAMSGVNLVLARWVVWRLLPPAAAPLRMRLEPLRRIGRFAFGMGAIHLLGLVLTQLDKAVLSLVLPLHQFGHYMLAWTLSTVINRISGPVLSAILPRLTQLASKGDGASLGQLFQRSGQVMALLVVPFSLFMATFSQEIVFLWTHDAEVARIDRWVLAILAVGAMVSSMMLIPYAVYVAQGKLRPMILINLVSLPLTIAMVWLLTQRLGMLGGAASWTLMQLGIAGATIGISWGHLGKAALLQWIGTSLALPVVLCGAFFALAKALLDGIAPLGALALAAVLAAAGLACQLLLLAALPFPRERALEYAGAFRRPA